MARYPKHMWRGTVEGEGWYIAAPCHTRYYELVLHHRLLKRANPRSVRRPNQASVF